MAILGFINQVSPFSIFKEIEVFLDVSHPTVVGIVSRMEQNGYVTCWQDEDKRNKNVKLTAKARSLGMDMEQHMLENEQHLLAPLNEAETAQLKQMLIQIYNHLE